MIQRPVRGSNCDVNNVEHVNVIVNEYSMQCSDYVSRLFGYADDIYNDGIRITLRIT